MRNAGLSYPPASAQTTQYTTVQYSTVHSTVTMGKWRLVKLLMCSAKYQRLTTEDYIRLGLCPPDQDAGTDSGHYVKNDKMVSWTLDHVHTVHMSAAFHCQKYFYLVFPNIFTLAGLK